MNEKKNGDVDGIKREKQTGGGGGGEGGGEIIIGVRREFGERNQGVLEMGRGGGWGGVNYWCKVGIRGEKSGLR